MNTANLQLEGFLVAAASLLDLMRRKDLLTQQEIDEALDMAETVVRTDQKRSTALSAAHVEAICFPIRFLRLATRTSSDLPLSFTQIAAMVGETKPDRDPTSDQEMEC